MESKQRNGSLQDINSVSKGNVHIYIRLNCSAFIASSAQLQNPGHLVITWEYEEMPPMAYCAINVYMLFLCLPLKLLTVAVVRNASVPICSGSSLG